MHNFINQANDLVKDKKFEEAKDLLEKNILPTDINIEALKLLGLCNINLKYTKQAMDAFEQVVAKIPNDATSWFYLGHLYDENNDLEKAENAYKTVISLREEYSDAYKNIAILYLKHRMPEKALAYAQKLAELEPLDYQAYYMLGTIAISKKDFETAIINYEKAAALNQSNVSIFNSLGSAYFATNRLDDAIKTFENALIIDEKNALAHYHLGNIAQIQKLHDNAFSHFQKAYNSDPSTLNLSALAYSALKAQKYDDAVMLYKTLCVIHPEKQNFQYNLACAYLAVKNYKEAIAILKKLVMMNPQSSTMAEKLAEVFMALGEVQDAQMVYELLIKKGKVSPETYYKYALICRQANDMDKATKIFKKVIELEPENAVAHKDLGVIYLMQRLFDYAKDEFQTALQLAPNDLQINFEFANFLYATGDYLGAKILYKKVTDELHDNAPCYFYQGLNFLALNEIQDAKTSFENSYKIEQNDLNRYHLARTHFYLRNFDKTLELLNELDTQDIDALNLMALTLYQKEMYDGAISIYKKILEKFNDNINIMLSLAKCYIKTKQKDEALNAINTTLAHFEDHEEALALKAEAEAL